MMKPVVYHSKKNHRFIIRPMEAGDARALLVFANALIAEDTFVMLSGKKMTLKEETAYVKEGLKRMKKNEKIRLVVVSGKEIIGSAEIRRGEKRKRHVGELGISILKSYRREGIGKTLMEMLIAQGQRLGLRMLMLHCFENNIPALSLYKTCGFIPCGLLPQALQYHGAYVGEVTLYKCLYW